MNYIVCYYIKEDKIFIKPQNQLHRLMKKEKVVRKGTYVIWRVKFLSHRPSKYTLENIAAIVYIMPKLMGVCDFSSNSKELEKLQINLLA